MHAPYLEIVPILSKVSNNVEVSHMGIGTVAVKYMLASK